MKDKIIYFAYLNLLCFMITINIGLLKVIDTVMIWGFFEEMIILPSAILGTITLWVLLIINLEHIMIKNKNSKENEE